MHNSTPPLPRNHSNIADEVSRTLAIQDSAQRMTALKNLHQGWLDAMGSIQQDALNQCAQFSTCFDLLISGLAQKALQSSSRISIIALGGYGRCELYPYSDIDLLILIDSKTDKDSDIQALLYPLWDLGLQVGHSVQNIKDCIALAQSDHPFATAIIEARLIAGDQSLFDAFTEARHKLFNANRRQFARGFIVEKIQEQQRRHQRFGDVRAMLEPNLKDGLGTLRDLQQIRWISFAFSNQTDPVEAGICSQYSARILRRAYRFFAMIRLQLHLQENGKDNRLFMHLQSDVASTLGYRNHKALRPIERLMKHFFWHRDQAILLNSIITSHLNEHDTPETQNAPKSFASAIDVLRYIAAKQKNILAIPAHILELLLRTRRLFILHGSDNQEARLLLRSILCAPSEPEHFLQTVRLLSQLGILGRMVHDYAHIQGLTQLDGYHAWTVDQHTIRVMSNLHAMRSGRQTLPDPAPAASCIDESVIFSAFLHDIAKGRGGKHAEKGAVCAEKLAPLFGFDDQETRTIAWLVRQHLLLSDLALHRDILDIGTTETLLNATPDAAHLEKLYCLTVADIQGVAPNSWTTWKATVIARLYRHGLELLQPSPPQINREQQISETIATLQTALRAALPDMTDSAFQQHTNLCTGEYLLSTTMPLLIEHAKMLADIDSLQPRESHIRLLPDPEDAIVRLILHTEDYSGLIAHTVGVLTEAGYSIVTLKTFPYGENRVLMTVWFHDQGKALLEERRLLRLKDRLNKAIHERFIDFEHQHKQPKSHITQKVTFDNTTSHRSTVIEIRTENRGGLLFDLTLALRENRLRIHAAKIDTVGNRALDVFYVRNRFGHKIYNTTHQNSIHASIMQRIR